MSMNPLYDEALLQLGTRNQGNQGTHNPKFALI